MDILNPQSLRAEADRALTRGRDPKKLVYVYAALGLALSALVNLVDLWLEQEISGAGGLSNLGTRAIFSTAQQVIPMIVSVVTMCLELGYLSGMMRIARGQYADHTDLKVGYQKFWPLLRLTLLQSMIYLAVGILAAQIGALIFSVTPLAEPAMEALVSLSSMESSQVAEADILRVLETLEPMYLICAVVFFIALLPFLFRMRMAYFCLLDDPRGRAMEAIRASSRMMRRRFLPMLKIDLRLWPYYAAVFLAQLLTYSGMLLMLLGIEVPLDGQVFSLLVTAAVLLVQFATQVLLRNRVEAVYMTAYDRLREKPKDSGTVVLGNIFDM